MGEKINRRGGLVSARHRDFIPAGTRPAPTNPRRLRPPILRTPMDVGTAGNLSVRLMPSRALKIAITPSGINKAISPQRIF